jgi:hypothetical protein
MWAAAPVTHTNALWSPGVAVRDRAPNLEAYGLTNQAVSRGPTKGLSGGVRARNASLSPDATSFESPSLSRSGFGPGGRHEEAPWVWLTSLSSVLIHLAAPSVATAATLNWDATSGQLPTQQCWVLNGGTVSLGPDGLTTATTANSQVAYHAPAPSTFRPVLPSAEGGGRHLVADTCPSPVGPLDPAQSAHSAGPVWVLRHGAAKTSRLRRGCESLVRSPKRLRPGDHITLWTLRGRFTHGLSST